MEALGALSVAAAVVQFVEFGGKAVLKGREIYKSADGALVENQALDDYSGRLRDLADKVQKELQVLEGQQHCGPLPSGDQALQDLSKECSKVSNELAEKLATLKLFTENGKRNRWESYRKGLKSAWSKGKVDEITTRLERLQNELLAHVLVALRVDLKSSMAQHESRFNSLDTDTQNIIQTLRNSETIRAVQFQFLSEQQAKEHKETRDTLLKHNEQRFERQVELSLLESLKFPTMSHRAENIKPAHAKTFEWIFAPPKQAIEAMKETYKETYKNVEYFMPPGKWSDFGQWLEARSGIYWINGKAGSGKSTLMHFIADHPETKRRLNIWKNGSILESPAFYFWNSGVAEQCSQAGLLRSLLHDVLSRQRQLIPGVFPNYWKKNLDLAKHSVTPTAEYWSYSQLELAFGRLVKSASENLRFCFFIDGLDEYSGDFGELSDYFLDQADNEFIKFCLSSRPLTELKNSLCEQPKLSLQNLTRGDIKRYINDMLKANKKMEALSRRNPKETADIIKQIANDSSGVFLWVTLVVKTLLTGLRKQDSTKDLKKRLSKMPKDLEKVYGSMLDSIEDIYVEEGIFIFSLYERATYSRKLLSPADLYIALIVDQHRVFGPYEADLQKALSEPVIVLNSFHTLPKAELLRSESFYDADSLHEVVELRLATRCGGLLELSESGNVEYLHRTARDFFYKNETALKSRALSSHGYSDNNVVLRFLMSRILQLKRSLSLLQTWSSKDVDLIINEDYIISLWEDIVYIFYDFGPRGGDLCIELLDEMDRVCTLLYPIMCQSNSSLRSFRHWSQLRLRVDRETTFLELCAKDDLWFYVENKLSENPFLLHSETGISLLASTIFLLSEKYELYFRFHTIEVIVKMGGDLNEVHKGYTLWQHLIHILHCLRREDFIYTRKDDVSSFEKLIKRRVTQGPGWDICCIRGAKPIFGWVDSKESQIFWEFELDELSKHDMQTMNKQHSQDSHNEVGGDSVKESVSGSNPGSDSSIDWAIDESWEKEHSLEAVVMDLLEKDFFEKGEELVHFIAQQRAADKEKLTLLKRTNDGIDIEGKMNNVSVEQGSIDL